jgi:hypothetical protein
LGTAYSGQGNECHQLPKQRRDRRSFRSASADWKAQIFKQTSMPIQTAPVSRQKLKDSPHKAAPSNTAVPVFSSSLRRRAAPGQSAEAGGLCPGTERWVWAHLGAMVTSAPLTVWHSGRMQDGNSPHWPPTPASASRKSLAYRPHVPEPEFVPTT